MPLADATQTQPPPSGSPSPRGTRGAAGAVRVVAPARLHLGFLDLNGDLGRRFGSIGLAIDRPATELMLTRSRQFDAEGPDAERALAALRRLAEMLGLTGTYRLKVASAIPSHAGLGSGTQLALAVGTALLTLEGIERDMSDIAGILDRGARSAIGMAAFQTGGFIVDGGRGAADRQPPILMRADFPDAWRILLLIDPRATGVHGKAEATAFADLPPLPEGDIAAFGAAVSEIQSIIGGYFAAAQGGGPWASPAVGRIAQKLKSAGAYGIGQSSWGPTGFAFTPSKEIAERLYISSIEAARAEGLDILIARGRNRGATVDRVAGT
jgi:beta-ribofuranosylaminobenzene 5'-phosphate synthase